MSFGLPKGFMDSKKYKKMLEKDENSKAEQHMNIDDNFEKDSESKHMDNIDAMNNRFAGERERRERETELRDRDRGREHEQEQRAGAGAGTGSRNRSRSREGQREQQQLVERRFYKRIWRDRQEQVTDLTGAGASGAGSGARSKEQEQHRDPTKPEARFSSDWTQGQGSSRCSPELTVATVLSSRLRVLSSGRFPA
jgi:hypothetical protein